MKIKLSKSDWELIGQKTGWLKTAQGLVNPINDLDNDHYTKPIQAEQPNWGFVIELIENSVDAGKTTDEFRKELEQEFMKQNVTPEDKALVFEKAVATFEASKKRRTV